MSERPRYLIERERKPTSKSVLVLALLINTGIWGSVFSGGPKEFWDAARDTIGSMIDKLGDRDKEKAVEINEAGHALMRDIEAIAAANDGEIPHEEWENIIMRGEALSYSDKEINTLAERLPAFFDGVADAEVTNAGTLEEQQQAIFELTKKIRYTPDVASFTEALQSDIPAGNCVFQAEAFARSLPNLNQWYELFAPNKHGEGHMRLVVQLQDGNWYAVESGGLTVVDISNPGTVKVPTDAPFHGLLEDYRNNNVHIDGDGNIFHVRSGYEPTEVYAQQLSVEETEQEYMERQNADMVVTDSRRPGTGDLHVTVYTAEEFQRLRQKAYEQSEEKKEQDREDELQQLIEDFQSGKRQMYFPPGNIYRAGDIDRQNWDEETKSDRRMEMLDTITYLSVIPHDHPHYQQSLNRLRQDAEAYAINKERGGSILILYGALAQSFLPSLKHLPEESVSDMQISITKEEFEQNKRQLTRVLQEGAEILFDDEVYTKSGGILERIAR